MVTNTRIKQVSHMEYIGPYTIVNTANYGINLSTVVPANNLSAFVSSHERKNDMEDDTSCVSYIEYKMDIELS